jgi:site-specific DNA recombinase
MKQLFAYIRVSTVRQGQGVSLQEQRAAIEKYVARTDAQIIEWFEERKTAAKTGRPEFARMVKLLRGRAASGVVIHKIDRSTRNYRDWAEIDELINSGVDVYCASDDLDLRSRGGRLAADIQMVVAVDYIRNLREEAIKGIHGRLKQGILPCHAPIGYTDCGAGKAKAIDPVKGPLVRALFERYATGDYTLRILAAEAERVGLRNRNGNTIHLSQFHKILRNPFYVGLIRSKRHGIFQGAHAPLVSRPLFDRVQAALDGKFVRRSNSFSFAFRRLFRCKTCGRSLVGSERKGHVYYRCQTVTCPTTSLREETIDAACQNLFLSFTLDSHEATLLDEALAADAAGKVKTQNARRIALEKRLSTTVARMSKLTDLLLDSKITSSTYDEKHSVLLRERQTTEQALLNVETDAGTVAATTARILGLARSARTLYKSANSDQRRRLMEIVTSDRLAIGKTLEFSLREPFASIAKRCSNDSGRPDWYTARTFTLENLISGVEALSTETHKLIEKFYSEQASVQVA